MNGSAYAGDQTGLVFFAEKCRLSIPYSIKTRRNSIYRSAVSHIMI